MAMLSHIQLPKSYFRHSVFGHDVAETTWHAAALPRESRLPGRSVIFAINPHILLASCEPVRTGVSATAPRYSKNVRRSICNL